MATDLATLAIRVDASQAKSEVAGLDSAFGKLKGAAAALGLTLGAGALFSKFIRETSESQYALAQLEARIKSTGGVAGQSSVELQAFATEMQRLTTYSDEAVQGAQALLLTFTRIRGDVFPEATKAALNLATAMGGDVKGAALQLGKALQDPEQGLLALRRSGVSFSEAQQDVIKSLFATGQQAEAQRLILKELEVEFGGAAEAARNTLGGAIAGLKNQFGELFEVSRSSSSGVVGAINAISGALPALDAKLQAVFGGFRLMWVDLQVAIQKFNAFFYDSIGSLAGGFAKLLSFLPGTTDEVKQLTAASDAMHLKAGILRDSFEAWRTEQEALITGTGRQADAVRTLSSATDDAVKSAYEMALADERASRAKELLNAQVKRAVDLEEELARVRAGGDVMKFSQIGIRDNPQVDDTIGGLVIPSPTNMAGTKAIDGWIALQQRLTKAYADAQADMAQIRENFLRGMQESFAKTFENIFTKGIKSFGDLFKSLGDLIKQAAAQLAASGLMKFLTGNFKAGAADGGGLMGGVMGVVKNIPAVGWIAGAVAGIAGLISSHHKAAEAAKRQSEENARLTLEHQKAADAAAAQAAAEARKAEVERAWQESLAAGDLRVRQLRMSGFDAEADALALWNQQVKEFADAVKSGFSAEFLAALSKTQEYERMALAANQAAEAQRKLAEAQEHAAESARAAAERLAATQERAAEWAVRMGDATESLAVRLLRAQGNISEADKKAFAMQQAQEVRAAQREIYALQKEMSQIPAQMSGPYWNYKDYWGGPFGPEAQAAAAQKAALQKMMDDQMKYIAELKVVQAAESTAFTAGQGLPAVRISQGGSFNTIVSRTTAEQGDRMVDNLVTMRVLAQEFWPYLKTIADRLSGGVNTMLGNAYQQSAALAGSSLVT